jgi:hypothetical protein
MVVSVKIRTKPGQVSTGDQGHSSSEQNAFFSELETDLFAELSFESVASIEARLRQVEEQKTTLPVWAQKLIEDDAHDPELTALWTYTVHELIAALLGKTPLSWKGQNALFALFWYYLTVLSPTFQAWRDTKDALPSFDDFLASADVPRLELDLKSRSRRPLLQSQSKKHKDWQTYAQANVVRGELLTVLRTRLQGPFRNSATKKLRLVQTLAEFFKYTPSFSEEEVEQLLSYPPAQIADFAIGKAYRMSGQYLRKVNLTAALRSETATLSAAVSRLDDQLGLPPPVHFQKTERGYTSMGRDSHAVQFLFEKWLRLRLHCAKPR